MEHIAWWLVVAYLVWLAQYAEITRAPREWAESKSAFVDKLLACSWCVGFWCSIVVKLVADPGDLVVASGLFAAPLLVQLGRLVALLGDLAEGLIEGGEE